MAFVKVASAKDLEPGHMIGVEAGGKEIAVINWRASTTLLEIAALT
jgi:hypothetical protein